MPKAIVWSRTPGIPMRSADAHQTRAPRPALGPALPLAGIENFVDHLDDEVHVDLRQGGRPRSRWPTPPSGRYAAARHVVGAGRSEICWTAA